MLVNMTLQNITLRYKTVMYSGTPSIRTDVVNDEVLKTDFNFYKHILTIARSDGSDQTFSKAKWRALLL